MPLPLAMMAASAAMSAASKGGDKAAAEPEPSAEDEEANILKRMSKASAQHRLTEDPDAMRFMSREERGVEDFDRTRGRGGLMGLSTLAADAARRALMRHGMSPEEGAPMTTIDTGGTLGDEGTRGRRGVRIVD
jgi:hypothetical protein